ncbi:MAG: hypothetical protein ACFWUC_01910 [Oscillospiraceae bacterium]|jgi:hypothetical protein
MQTTRWADLETDDINEAIKLILKPKQPDKSYNNWDIKKKFEENQSILLNGKKITFNYISYSYDYILSSDNSSIEDMIRRQDGFIIVYDNGVKINYIISKNSGALTFMRKLLGYTGRNQIVVNNLPINSELFVWLISKVYNSDSTIESEDFEDNDAQNLTIDAIKGFKGNSDDLLTKVSANGESVMNILSTLSFLLESRSLNQIIIDLQCNKHKNLELTLTAKSTLAISLETYIGEFENDCKELCISKLYLLVYLELLPLIIQAMQKEKEDGLWNNVHYVEFLKNVAAELSQRVKKKIQSLE